MLKASELPKRFWANAIKTTIYVSNISPTYAVLQKQTHEIWYGVKPRVSHLRVFGCVAFVHIPI